MDAVTKMALDGIAEAEIWKRNLGPIVISDEYWRLIERVEQLPESRPGTDKTWTERAVTAWRREVRSARVIPRE